MNKIRTYTVMRKGQNGKTWLPILMGSHISQPNARSFVNGMQQFQSCPELLIRCDSTGEAIARFEAMRKEVKP